MKIEEVIRTPLGDNLVNFIFLGSLLFLIVSKTILIPKSYSVFKFSSLPAENENFTLYTALCSLVYTVILTLVFLPFYHVVIPFYNSELMKFFSLFVLLAIYQVVFYMLGNMYFFILGKNKDYQENYKNRFIFLFIKLMISILLCIIIYYTNFPKEYLTFLVLGFMSLLFISEWIWLMFFIKNKIKLPSYYDFLYLCTFEILPALCVLKLVFLGEKL